MIQRKSTVQQKWIAALTLLIFAASPSSIVPLYAAHVVSETYALTAPFKLEISPELGVVQEIHPGHSRQIVIHIQDAHANYSAQKNIARLIDYLKTGYGFDAVAAEGAPAGSVDTSPISWIPAKDRLPVVLDSLLRKAFITGPEYQHALSGSAFRYFGIEDASLYRQNLLEYLEGIRNSQKVAPALADLRQVLSDAKRRVYHKKLYELDNLVQQYRLSQEKYHERIFDELKKLAAFAAQENISRASFPEIDLLLRAEKSKDIVKPEWSRLEAERNDLERILKEKLLRTGEEKRINEAEEYVALLQGLVRLELTREQYEAYLRGKNRVRLNETGKWLQTYQASFQLVTDLERRLHPFEYFYETAARRDQVLIKNVMNQFPESGKVILVAGGFHTKGLETELRKKGVTYVSVSPTIDNFPADAQVKYFAALQNEKSKLARTLIQLSSQTINQAPGSLDPYADMVTFVEFLQWGLAESRRAFEQNDLARVSAIQREIRDSVSTLRRRNPDYAGLFRHPEIFPGKIVFSSGALTPPHNVEVTVQPNPEGGQFHTHVRILPRSEIRASQIQASDYLDMPDDGSEQREINHMMRLLSRDFSSSQIIDPELPQDPHEAIEKAFLIYKNVYKTRYAGISFEQIPDVGFLKEKAGKPWINRQLLHIMSFKALDASDFEDRKIWAAMFLHVVPVRNAFLETKFPGVLYFLAAVDRQLAGQVKETFKVLNIQDKDLRLKQDGAFLESTEFSKDITAELNALTREVGEFVKDPGKGVVDIRKSKPAKKNVNEFFTMLKPPGMTDNPETVRKYFQRIYAFGYEPVGVRLIRGNALPDSFVRRHYPEISDWALYGRTDLLSHVGKENFRLRYQAFYGSEIPDPPAGLLPPMAKKFVFEVDPETNLPRWPIRGFEEIFDYHYGNLDEQQRKQKRQDLHEKFADHYARIDAMKLVSNEDSINSAERSPSERLWSRQQGIEASPNTRDVTLFYDPELYGGEPFFVPNMFFSGFASKYKSPNSVILAVVMRAKTPHAVSWELLRNNFVGGSSQPAKSLPGSMRWDAKNGKLGNDPALVNYLTNGVHGSASPIEAVMEMRLWFADLNVQTFQDQNFYRISGTTFGKSLMDAGFSEDQVNDLIASTDLKGLLIKKNAAEALESILQWEIPFLNQDPSQTAPITPKAYQTLTTKYNQREIGIQKNAIESSITPLQRSDLRAGSQGSIMVMIGPSGAGKSKLMQMLIQKYQGRFHAVTQFTTRSARPKEVDGVDYHFISRDQFQSLEKENKLTLIRGRIGRYGILKEEIDRALQEGKIPILNFQEPEEIDQLRSAYPELLPNIFAILPMEVEAWNDDMSSRMAALVHERLVRRDPAISQTEIDDRLNSMKVTVPRLLQLPDVSVIVNEKGKTDIAFAKLEADLNRSDLKPLRGRALAVIGPSVSGKNELIRRLINGPDGQRFQEMIQFTTRMPRPNELDDIDYRFMSEEEFRSLQAQGKVSFIRGRTASYGVLTGAAEELMQKGKIPVFNLQDAEEIDELKKTYPGLDIDIFVILPLKIDGWNQETMDKVADLMRKRLVQRDPKISEAHIHDRIQSALSSLPKLLKLSDAAFILNEDGKLDAASEQLASVIRRSEIRSHIYNLDMDPEKLLAAKTAGSAVLKDGRLGIVINSADTGDHPYFSAGSPTSIRMLRSLTEQDKRAITAAELKLRHIHSIAQEEKAAISIDIGLDKKDVDQFQQELQRHKNYGLTDKLTPLELFSLGHVPYMTPLQEELNYAYQQAREPVSPDVESYVHEHRHSPVRNAEGRIQGTNMGNLDILIQFVLSGRFRQRLAEGKEIFYFSNGEDLGGLIDKVKIGLFANAPEKIWFVAAEADQVFHISRIDSLQGKWKVIMRKGKTVMSNLPKNHSIFVENGRIVARKKLGGKEFEVGVVVESAEPEYGAYLTNVNGQPRFVERTAFPLGYDVSQLKPAWVNTNQMLIKADALLEFFNLTRNEYMKIGQRELLEKVSRAVEQKMKTYTGIDWLPLLITEKGDRMKKVEVKFPAVKFTRLLADLSAHLDSGYLLVDRESYYGWYPVLTDLDTYLLRTEAQIDDLLKEVELSRHPAEDLLARESSVEFRDDLTRGRRVVFNEGRPEFKGREFNVSAMSEFDFKNIIGEMTRIKLEHSRFPGLNNEFFLGSAVEEDFFGRGLLAEFTDKEFSARRERLGFLLERIYQSSFRWEFLKFLWEHKHTLVTFRNVNTPIYAVLVNYLLGRPLQDRQFVEAHRKDLFAGNMTLDQHPVFGTSQVAGTPLDAGGQVILPKPAQDRPLRVLFFGAGEKYGPNSKMDYFREILRALPDGMGERVEIHAWDINFPQIIYALDQTAQNITVKTVYPFDAKGEFYDRERRIHFRKLNVRDPREMATSDAYELAKKEQFDVVITSRVEIWYKKEPRMQYALSQNMMKHLAPGGVLLYDNYATDRLKVIRRDESNQFRAQGYIPYQDHASGEKDVKRILGKFRMDSAKFNSVNALRLTSEEISKIIKTAYQLAGKYVAEGHYVFDKKVFANFIAQFSQDPISTAAILIHHVSDQVVREAFAFSPHIAEDLVREKNLFGTPEGSDEIRFGKMFFRWLEEDFYRPEALEARAADGFLSDTTRVFGNAIFTVEHGLAVERDEEDRENFIPALRMTNHRIGQTIIYYPPKEKRRSTQRSELRRDYRQDMVPLSEKSFVGRGLQARQTPDADEFVRAILNTPQRVLDPLGDALFSLPEKLRRSEVVTVRENNKSRAKVVQLWKQGKSVAHENLGVIRTPDGKVVLEETLAGDFIGHGLASELASVVEANELKAAFEETGIPEPRLEAKKAAAALYGTSVINSGELQSLPDDYLYYFTARKYGLEKEDRLAQKIVGAYALREQRRSELRLLRAGKQEWKNVLTQALPGNVIQGAIVVTESQLESGTVTRAELASRVQDDPNGQIQLHIITKPGRDLASAHMAYKKILGVSMSALLFDEIKNPQGRIHIHTVPNFQSTQAAIHRVSAGLTQSLLPAPGETQVQDYQIILIADEKIAQNVHHGLVKFVARGQNIGLLSAAYLFIPYRGNIPDSIFGSNFHKGDLFNAYYLTPLENLGFFLRETAEIQRHILTQA